MGCLRICEMHTLKTNQIERHGNELMLVKITSEVSKNKTSKSFTIQGDYLKIVEKYVALCPKDAQTDHFFLNYQKGKYTKQNIGINKIGDIGKKIAKYLNLPDPKKYTGKQFLLLITYIHNIMKY